MMLPLLTGLVLSLAGPAAADRPGKVELVQERSAAVSVGDTVWLAFTWRARGDLENFRVVVRRTDAAEIGYPDNTATYSGPYQSPHLMDGEIDYTAIRVHVPETSTTSRSKDIKLQLEASWDGGGRRQSSVHNLKVPTTIYEGTDVAQITDSVEVTAGGGAWVEVAYSGLAPIVERFAVVVDADPALPITYPGYGSKTSLHHDAALQDGETDVVRFFVDAAEAAPGEYQMNLAASFARGERPSGLEGVLTVSVATP
jgi:hypothetical protein